MQAFSQHYSEKTRERIAALCSGECGYIPKAITCAVKTLDEIAGNESLPESVRDDAAYAAANLIISDFDDKDL